MQIDIGLEMVDRLCERGEQLVSLNPKKASKVSKTVEQLREAATQLRSTCAERTLRLNEANELVKWGQLMDEAVEAAKHTEARLMSDDYHRGENGLKRLLEQHEVGSHEDAFLNLSRISLVMTRVPILQDRQWLPLL